MNAKEPIEAMENYNINFKQLGDKTLHGMTLQQYFKENKMLLENLQRLELEVEQLKSEIESLNRKDRPF